MKKIIGILTALVMCLTLTSCVTTAEAQVATDDYASVDVIITYGTPYYNANGLLLYYMYNDLYYYPHYYGDRWYFRRYSTPQRHYTPYRRDFYRHRPHHYRHTTPRGNYHRHTPPPSRPRHNMGGGSNHNRQQVHTPRSSTRMSGNHSGGRNFGGRK